MMIFTFVMILLSGAQRRRYDIQLLKDKPGLYFAEQYQFLLTSEHWVIAIDTDLRELEAKLSQIDLIWEETAVLRNASDLMIWAGPYFEKSWNAIKRTTKRVKQLYDIVGASDMIVWSKRGIFNTVGFGLKTLFGTMDSDDAEYFNEKYARLTVINICLLYTSRCV